MTIGERPQRIHRGRWRAVLIAAAILGSVVGAHGADDGSVAMQQATGTRPILMDTDPVFRQSPDKRVIAKQIEAALPVAERGLQLLQAASNEAQIADAIQYIYDGYRFLRAAEESGRRVEGNAAIKDPLANIRNDHIANIRLRLRWCRDHREHLMLQEQEYTGQCIEGLHEAVRELKLVIAILP
ncbi:MAG TPA: hypothetical protein VJX92_21215 [Methylomirabilota bacterium]|nr:hypothetical protein [Methylomirabilota bacterium]